jgi:hypothetical protein
MEKITFFKTRTGLNISPKNKFHVFVSLPRKLYNLIQLDKDMLPIIKYDTRIIKPGI